MATPSRAGPNHPDGGGAGPSPITLGRSAREKITVFGQPHKDTIMDAEHINSIGTRLADLSARVVELRRYL
ncbi:hypothetical protein GCM10028785_31060 [Hydrogenophaga soli]